ncbi:MAG: hypothetical protein MH252_06690 [Thermosynechococcaceae cyanobacterium MS004]|nr:hypothetical protein [Thermosynechococcaceae cyanobacterium MS004]
MPDIPTAAHLSYRPCAILSPRSPLIAVAVPVWSGGLGCGRAIAFTLAVSLSRIESGRDAAEAL